MTRIAVWGIGQTSPEALAHSLPDDEIIRISDQQDLPKASSAEIGIGGTQPHQVKQLLEAAPDLRWYHAGSVGVEGIVPEFRNRRVALTNNSGAYDAPVGEFVISLILEAAKRLHIYRDRQGAQSWMRDLEHDEVREATVVVYGMGSIGTEVGRLAKALGMKVIGIRRHAWTDHSIDESVGSESLIDVAAKADYLVVTAAYTNATRGAISQEVIARMKSAAWIVNVARAGILDQNAVLEALTQGRLAGVAFDVFETEPLPRDSVLWSMPNVIVTPHKAQSTARMEARTLALICENVRRFKSDEELLNRVDIEAGY